MNIPTVQIEGEPDTHPERGSRIIDARMLAEHKVDLSMLKIRANHTEVFDLMSADDRKAYETLYVELMTRVKAGEVLVFTNSREVLTRPDGSTGWFKYLEWIEIDTSEILGARPQQ